MKWSLIAVALPTVGLLMAAIWAFRKESEQEPVRQRLQRWVDWEHQRTLVVEQPRRRTRRRDINTGAGRFFFPKLRRTLQQVRSPYNVLTFLLLIFVVFVVSGILLWIMTTSLLQSLMAAIVFGAVPIFVLIRKKQQYRKKFEEQLPQALDILARSLWAGHTIQAGIRTIGADFDEPVRSEFSRTAEAIDVGTPLPVALEQLASRVDISDLHFFVTSVLVQRETGGNLADILSRTANLIRERLEFNERIKALSAQGKLSARVLCVLPLAIAGLIYYMNPQHFDIMFEEPLGMAMLVISGAMMVVGVIFVQRLVKIDI